MIIDFLTDKFSANREQDAIVWHEKSYSYGWMEDTVKEWLRRLEGEGVPKNSVVSLEADFSPNAVALMLALIERGCIIVPLTRSMAAQKSECRQIAEVETIIQLDSEDLPSIRNLGNQPAHELLHRLKHNGHPGLVLFSSGSTGKSKAAVHDFIPLLEKFKVARHARRTITFLMFDHIGGVNTLLYTLANGGCAVMVEDRSPTGICRAIERHKVQLLPTSPTFIHLLIISEAYKEYDLSSLQLVTYGTEAMPEGTLKRFHALFPDIQLLQTYGLSEVGILRSQSRSSDSLWLKIGGEGFETRVVHGILEIKARSAMLGYLNAPSPFSEDGWFNTGDAVEVDGDYIHILGRSSEMINVGGEKVYPAEVESVIQQMEGVEDITISGEPNPVTGHMVKARVKLKTSESLGDFRMRMRNFCKDKLPPFKIPQKVVLIDQELYGERFKKMRREPQSA
jgi:acyl-coenzyme A synthetase/AMP-(fatty) acid ligase